MDNNEGELTELGAINASTGKYTGRSPKDKFIVTEPSYKDNIHWEISTNLSMKKLS